MIFHWDDPHLDVRGPQVYLAKHRRSNIYKIGRTHKSTQSRLRQIKVETGLQLDTIMVIKCDTKNEADNLELTLHERFKEDNFPLRYHREFFYPESVDTFIGELIEKLEGAH